MDTEKQVAQTFEIPVANLPAFVAKLGDLIKRAVRLGFATDAIGFEELRRFERTIEKVRDEDGKLIEIKRTYAEIRVFGPAPSLSGWALIGRLDFEAVPGACVRMMVPGEVCPPEFYEAEATRCDHCHARRQRNDTFLVRHEDGTIKVIGRTCLADFLGHKSPEQVAALCTMLCELAAMGGEDSYGGRGFFGGWDVAEVLEVAAYSIRKNGWVSSKMDGATRDHVSFLLEPQRQPMVEADRKAQLAEVSPKDRAMGAAALAWILEQSHDTSDYIHNLYTAAKAGAVMPKMLGIVVSGIVAFTRSLEREVERRRQRAAQKDSQHVGKVKERFDIEGEVVLVRSTSGYYGTTTIIKIVADGNVFTWFASKDVEVVAGDRVKVRGTVKKHDNYKGTPQTVLTRCTLEVVEEQLGIEAEAEGASEDAGDVGAWLDDAAR